MNPLPIDAVLPQVVQALRAFPALVIEAPPGAGKTTRVPRALLDAGFADKGEILVLQPRRLPTRLAAARVAEELGESPGQTVGYSVRFEDVSGLRTKVRFVTEGILTRKLCADPSLEGVAVVILDEFHERHWATDLALPLLRGLQRSARRPDLRLCVMSATLESDSLRAFLGNCPMVVSEGRTFEVSHEYVPSPADRPLPIAVRGAVQALCREGLDGDVLVFLPGAADIRRCAEALPDLARQQNLMILPLHGELPVAEQNRAIAPAPAGHRKVILSTNVAETSVTIDGVVAVIDSGLARIAGHSPWSCLPTLTTAEISQASAIQRAGRAGRTRPGRVVRLYARHEFESRRVFDVPEIQRMDLAEPLLALAAMGAGLPEDFAWFDAPPPAALNAGKALLRQLAAIDERGVLTPVGHQMARVPLHPRLGRLLIEAGRRGVAGQGAVAAALISERDIAARTRDAAPEGADLLERLDRFEQARAARFSASTLRRLDLAAPSVEAVDRTSRHIRQTIESGTPRASPPGTRAADEALAMAVLAAFPDRVLRRRGGPGSDALLAAGGSAHVKVGLVPQEDLMVAIDVEERAAHKGRAGAGVFVRLAVGIRPEWLLELAPGSVSERNELEWNPTTERVEQVSGLAYGLIVLEETRRAATPSPGAARLLAEAAARMGWEKLGRDGVEAATGIGPRLHELRQAFPEANVPVFEEGGTVHALEALCEGCVSFIELRARIDVTSQVTRLPANVQHLLRSETPEKLRLPGGREVTVHYQAGAPPWIESRLQDFFGMSTTPAICRGRVPLTIHLLAPNGRALQVTRDLAGFWRQHYPALRRELSRRYPRHPWPENGATASPPPPRAPRK